MHRERRGADDFVPDGDLVIGGRVITSYGQMYALGFNELRKSVRLWSKRGGPKGYIKFVRERVDEILAHEPALQERAAHSDKPNKLQESLDEFAAHHGITLSTESTRELPADVTEEQSVYHRSYSRNPAAHVDRLREIHADLPEYPQLTNDLIGALYAAGRDAEATQVLEQMVAEHPDDIVGVSQYVSIAQEYEQNLRPIG